MEVPNLVIDGRLDDERKIKTKNKTQLIIKDLSSKNLFFFNSLLFPKEKREKRFWKTSLTAIRRKRDDR